MQGGVAADEIGQDAVVGGADEREFQAAGLAVAQSLGELGQGGDAGERGAHMDQPLLAKRGEGDAALAANEQRRAQLTLQRHDRLAKRRLGHVQLPGGAAKVQELGDRREMPELPSVHV